MEDLNSNLINTNVKSFLKISTVEDTAEVASCLNVKTEVKTEPPDYSENIAAAQATVKDDENSFLKLKLMISDYLYQAPNSSSLTNDSIVPVKLENESIKFEELDIKCEPEDCCTPSGILERQKRSESNVFKCPECDFTGIDFRYFKQHYSKHKSFRSHKCKMCTYQTHSRRHLTSHLDQHKNDLKIYKCDQCKFETQHSVSLKRHLDRHKNPKDVKLYECNECAFQTPFIYNLKTHLKGHMVAGFPPWDKSQLLMLYTEKCSKCDYRTHDKSNFRRHVFSHDESDAKVYTCFDCGHQTKRKDNLEIHINRRHKRREQIKDKRKKQINKYASKRPIKYICKICDFVTESLSNLQIHQLSHENAKPLTVYKCDDCEFETIYKMSINRHKIAFHKRVNEISMFECFLCKYKAVRKDELKSHILRHKKKSEVGGNPQ